MVITGTSTVLIGDIANASPYGVRLQSVLHYIALALIMEHIICVGDYFP